MKMLSKYFFVLLFLCLPILNQGQAQEVQSVNGWRYPFSAELTDFLMTKSYFSTNHTSQVFANYGKTHNMNLPNDIPYWSHQGTWLKDSFLSFTTPDMVYLDCNFLSGVNIEKIIAINVFIAIQNSNHWFFDGRFTEYNKISLNSTWKTLHWDMKVAKDFGMNFFTRFYIAFQIVTQDSAYVGAEIDVDNLRGYYNDSKETIVYDDFGGPTKVSESEQIPSEFVLYQNYPNPFNPTTTIKYSIPVETLHATSQQNITLKVYDMLGHEVATLVNEEKAPGNYEVKFNGSNLSSGVYFYRLQTGSFSETKKFVLMK